MSFEARGLRSVRDRSRVVARATEPRMGAVAVSAGPPDAYGTAADPPVFVHDRDPGNLALFHACREPGAFSRLALRPCRRPAPQGRGHLPKPDVPSAASAVGGITPVEWIARRRKLGTPGSTGEEPAHDARSGGPLERRTECPKRIRLVHEHRAAGGATNGVKAPRAFGEYRQGSWKEAMRFSSMA